LRKQSRSQKNHIMKKSQKSIYCLLITCLLIGTLSCKKDKEQAAEETPYTCATCKTTADAKVENNVISKGVYKGVVIGSTGIITIDVLNGGTTILATLVLDGQTINMTSAATWAAGTALTANFTGTANSQNYSFAFTVQANGSSPTASSYSIPGHSTIAFQLIKETSDNLIKCYEGTTQGVKDSGASQASTLNIITSGKTNTWFALSRDNGSSSIGTAGGSISGNTITCDCGPTTSVVGTITADKITGTYKGSDNHGTFTAKRTL
jgi:hypothetical protein